MDRQGQSRTRSVRRRYTTAAATVAALCLLGSGDARGATGTLGPSDPNVGGGAPAHAVRADDRALAARTLLRAGNYARVEAIARTLLAEAEESRGRDSIASARAIDLLVAALVRSGKARDAETSTLARRAVMLKELTAGSDRNELAASQYGLAEQLRMSGAYSEARGAYERALAARGGAVGEADTAGLVELLRGYAAFLLESAEYARARALLERALASAEHELGPEDPDVALVLVDMARLLHVTGNYVDGRPLLDRALAIQEKTIGPDHLETAYTLRELGELLRLSGDYAAARPFFDRALAIREKVLGPDHLEVADVLHGLGVLLRRTEISKTHRCPQAYPVCERAFTIAEKTLGPDHPLLARYLDGYAWAVFQCTLSVQTPAATYRPVFQRAHELFERSLSIHEKAFGGDHPACLDALGGLASTSQGLVQSDRAIAWYQRRLAIELRTLGPDNVEAGLTRMELAHAQALSTVIESGVASPEPHREQVFRYDTTSPALPAAIDNALESERVSREHARLTARSLSETEAHRLNASRWSLGFSIALSICVRGADPEVRLRVFDALVRSRALVLDVTASRHRAILRSSEPDVERLAHHLDAARGRLADLVVRRIGATDPDAYRRSLDEAQRAEKDAERALAARSAGFAAEFDRSNLGAADLIAALPAGSALVAYATYLDNYRETDNSYVAFVVRSGDRTPTVIPLALQEHIDELVADWRRQISQAPAGDAVLEEAAALAAGANLRQKIWDPIAVHLRGVQRVFIVPDGTLNTINFGALPVGRGAYLLEQAPILHYLSSERDLVLNKRASGGGFLALGGPAYDASNLTGSSAAAPRTGSTFLDAATPYRGSRSMCESFQRMRFPPLPEAAKEATGLISLWSEVRQGSGKPSGARELLGAQATEDAFKRLAPGNRFLHVATHGFFLGGACLAALDPASNDGVAVKSLAGENPLLLSGLALAGANHRSEAGPEDEDGILTAEEIAALDLTGVEWAVLSACDTASGDIRTGEGVLGLQRAFRIAGAHTVVMSLWPVDDRATRRWMQRLYEGHLRRGLDTAASVRAATLAALADRRRRGLDTHPFYWAGFIASGDWR